MILKKKILFIKEKITIKINIKKSNSKKNLNYKKNKKFKSNQININPHYKEIIIALRAKDKFNVEQEKIKNIDKIQEPLKKLMSFNDEELNDLEYKLALKLDKRNYCQYYFSLLKSKHALIFTFCNNTDYNSKIIKIDLFFI